jgi:hypothetical protein
MPERNGQASKVAGTTAVTLLPLVVPDNARSCRIDDERGEQYCGFRVDKVAVDHSAFPAVHDRRLTLCVGNGPSRRWRPWTGGLSRLGGFVAI